MRSSASTIPRPTDARSDAPSTATDCGLRSALIVTARPSRRTRCEELLGGANILADSPLGDPNLSFENYNTIGVNMKSTRSLMLAVAIVAAHLPLVPTGARAQDGDFYRGKTVNLVVGYSAGGGYDQYARLLARHFGRHIPGNPSIVVQNMPGAATFTSVRYLSAT